MNPNNPDLYKLYPKNKAKDFRVKVTLRNLNTGKDIPGLACILIGKEDIDLPMLEALGRSIYHAINTD